VSVLVSAYLVNCSNAMQFLHNLLAAEITAC